MHLSVLALLACGLAVPAAAQAPPPRDLPSERPLEIPIPEDVSRPEARPVLRPAPQAIPQTALPELHVVLRAIDIRGNSVLDTSELAAVAEPYLDREVSTEEIETLRRELTMLYVARGYVTSGAVVPDQDLAGGVLYVQIIEGRIGELRIEGNDWFRQAYLRQRILPDPSKPLEVGELERRLQLLQADPQVKAVHARLSPGVRLGESSLRVRIEERRPYALAFDSDNYRSPAIGEFNGRVDAGMRNLAGWGDRARVRGQFGEGLQDVKASYEIPFTRWDTRAALRFRWSQSRIVESPFDAIDVESDFLSGGIEIRQPLIHTLRDELSLGVLAEWRRGRNYVNGSGFSFSDGSDRGVSVTAPVRPYLEWIRRDRSQVIALRGQVSVGLPILGYSNLSGAAEDGTFVAGLLQAQWARRFDELIGVEIILRADLQLADQPLLPIEQFSIGGHASVRGYRENQIVRDNGAVVSLEVRVPILRRPDGRPILQLAPFGDIGRAWDDGDREDSAGKTLGSVGLGLRYFPVPWLKSELYWGYRITDVPNPHDALQDYGVQFRVTATVF